MFSTSIQQIGVVGKRNQDIRSAHTHARARRRWVKQVINGGSAEQQSQMMIYLHKQHDLHEQIQLDIYRNCIKKTNRMHLPNTVGQLYKKCGNLVVTTTVHCIQRWMMNSWKKETFVCFFAFLFLLRTKASDNTPSTIYILTQDNVQRVKRR